MRASVPATLLVMLSATALAMPETPGSEPADLHVRANSGAARIALPIEVPLGTGQFTPELAIEYSSHLGDGALGMGWRLRLPEVRRATRFGVPAYDDAVDRFALNDELLVSAGSAGGDDERFHPFTETFQRIVKKADGSWEVTETDGRAARYGADATARIEGGQGPDPTARWLLSEIEDVNGNVIAFTWSALGDTGQRYLTEISYTQRAGSPVGALRRVELLYEDRPDPIHGFPGGVEKTVSKRLKEIRSTIGGTPFRRVWIQYSSLADGYATHRTRLASVQVFGSDCDAAAAPDPTIAGSGCTVMPEQTFAYTDPADQLASGTSTQWSPASWDAPIAFEDGSGAEQGSDLGVRIRDVDGDGLPDLLRAYDDDGTLHHEVYLNTGSGWTLDAGWSQALAALQFPAARIESDANVVPEDVDVAFSRKGGWSENARANPYRPPVIYRLVDLNQDGRVDIVASLRIWDLNAHSTTPFVSKRVWLNTGTGWVREQTLEVDLPPVMSYEVTDLKPASFGDWLCVRRPSENCTRYIVRFGEGLRFPDLNGDGLLDLAAWRDDSFWSASFAVGHTVQELRIQTDAGWQLLGPGYDLPAGIVGDACIGHDQDYGARFVDLNGDGLDDLVKKAPADVGGAFCYATEVEEVDSPYENTSQPVEGVWMNTGLGWCGASGGCYGRPEVLAATLVHSGQQPSAAVSHHPTRLSRAVLRRA